MLRRFKWDRDEIWQECSSSKCTSIDGIGISIAAMTSFHAIKCSQRVCSSVRQFYFCYLLHYFNIHFIAQNIFNILIHWYFCQQRCKEPEESAHRVETVVLIVFNFDEIFQTL